MKADELAKVKDQAARYLKKQEWDKALERYQVLVKEQPKDLRTKMKLGDILLKLKKKDEALTIYEEIADAYAKDKFLIQAISVYKLIEQTDPKRAGIKDKLLELNQARGIPVGGGPAAVPPDAEPGLPKAPEKSLKKEIEEVKQQKEEQKQDKGGMRFPDTPLFGQLGEQEFTEVVSKFQVGTIPKGTLVIKEGTKGDSFFIVSEGDIRVFRTYPKSGRKKTLAHLTAGAFFGEMAFFMNSVRTASCETAEETVLLRINRKDLEGMMERFPNIREVMRDFFKKRALDQMVKMVPLFESLEEAELEVLKTKFQMLEVDAGEFLIQEGEEGEWLYVIFSGECEVTAQHPDKGPVKLATMGPGEYVGEISIIQGRLNTADVITSSPCILFRLAKPVFKELISMHPPMKEELARIIEQRLKNTLTALI